MNGTPRERWLALSGPDGTVQVRVVDVARARHLRLSLSGDGPRLSKPAWVPLHEAQRFLAERASWLHDRLREQAARDSGLPRLAWCEGERFDLPLRGAPVAVELVAGARPLLVDAGHEGLRLALPDRPPEQRQRLAAGCLRGYLEQAARQDLGRLLALWTPRLGRAPTRVRVRPLRSLWGSLSARGHLSLDLALALAPPAQFEYVLVHELCHLFEHNHGPRFWARVEAALPDYRARQAALRADGARLKALLAALLQAPPRARPGG